MGAMEVDEIYLHLQSGDPKAAGPAPPTPFVPLRATTRGGVVPVHQVGRACREMLQCVDVVRLDRTGDGLWPMPWSEERCVRRTAVCA